MSAVQEVRAERARRVRVRDSSGAAVLLVGVIALASGLSPLLGGFYSFPVLGVIALGMLAVAWALVLVGESVPARLAVVALAALVGLAAISLLSVAWSESASNALTGASRWILYASTFGIFVVTVRTARVARLGMAAAAAGSLVVAAYILGVMVAGDGPSLFLGGRLNEPLGYINSQGLFLVLGVWPLLGLAQYARPVPAGLASAGATVLMALAFLSQARGVVLAFVVAAIAVLLFVPGRQRSAWLLLLTLGGIALISSPLLDIYDLGGQQGAPFEDAIRGGAGWILLAAAVIGVIWGVGVAAEPRLGVPGLRRASAVGLGAVVLVVGGVLSTRADSIRTYVHDQAKAFTSLQPTAGRSRLLSGGGNRYDYWRIAVHEFADHPVVGVGTDNYTRDYFIRRATSEDVRQPHSIEFQTLAELGLAGAIALALFLAAVALGLVRHIRASGLGPGDRVLLVGSVGAFSAWLTHSSVDWSHLVPGATGVALLAAASLVMEPEDGQPAEPQRLGVPTVAVRALLSVAIVVGAIFVGRAVAARHYLDEGKHSLRTDPVKAIQNSNNSLALNDDSLQALFLKSAGYARLGDYQRSRAALVTATRLEPHNFLPWALLGDLEVRRGRLEMARRSYARASLLNPRDSKLRILRHDPRP